MVSPLHTVTDPDAPVVTADPSALGHPASDVGVLVSTQPDLQLFQNCVDAAGCRSRRFLMGQALTIDRPDGGGGVVLGPYIGAPYAAMLLEQLVAWGCRQVVCLGWCGSLVPDLSAGDVILATAACCDDGVSRIYTGHDCPEILSTGTDDPILQAYLRALTVPVKTGCIWTTDALYRETPARIDGFRDSGAIAVDMETAGLFAVSAFHGVQLSSLLVVSDQVGNRTWKKGFKKQEFIAHRKQLISCLANWSLNAEYRDKDGNNDAG
ncbi:MAG: uridine phosphorylase [Deltaproteobacteria bacterium]|nr:MAG: uridine phosphorylase [Deltaproteobacteria bacterium]